MENAMVDGMMQWCWVVLLIRSVGWIAGLHDGVSFNHQGVVKIKGMDGSWGLGTGINRGWILMKQIL